MRRSTPARRAWRPASACRCPVESVEKHVKQDGESHQAHEDEWKVDAHRGSCGRLRRRTAPPAPPGARARPGKPAASRCTRRGSRQSSRPGSGPAVTGFVGRSQQSGHQPWLPPDLRHEPAGDRRNPAGDAHGGHGPEHPPGRHASLSHRPGAGQATATISRPIATITRNAKNTGTTGGMAGSKSSSPCTTASGSCLSRRLAARGISIAYRLARAASSGIAISTSGAPLRVSQRPSIAAIFAGWCSTLSSPCRSSSSTCNGAGPPRPGCRPGDSAGCTASAREQPPGRQSGNDEGGRERRCVHHVAEPIGERRIEDHLAPVDRDQLPVLEAVSCGRMQPGIQGQDPEGGKRRADRDECGRGDVKPADTRYIPKSMTPRNVASRRTRTALRCEQRSGDVPTLDVAGPVGPELE